jgi:hypothetical protein
MQAFGETALLEKARFELPELLVEEVVGLVDEADHLLAAVSGERVSI